MLCEFQIQDGVYYYTADTEYEMTGVAPTNQLGYIYKCATAVQRFESPDGQFNYWSILPRPTPPTNWMSKGPAFYAFAVPSPHTVPVFSFTGMVGTGSTTSSEQDQILDVVFGHQPNGWTQEQGIMQSVAFWAYPPTIAPIGSGPLQHWQTSNPTRNFFTVSPSADGMFAPNSSWILCDTFANVIPVPAQATGSQAPFYAPPMTLNSLYGIVPQTEGATSRNLRDADAYISLEAKWWGVNVYLSHQATSDASNGLSVAGALSAAIAVTSIPSGIAAAIMGLVSAALWGLASTVSVIDRGNGIRLSLPWTDLLSYSAFVPPVIIPWPQ